MWSSRVVARSIAKMRLQGGNRSSNAKVSAAGIRLDSRKIYLAFNGIICDDISEFESYMPSQAVESLSASGMKGSQSIWAFEPPAGGLFDSGKGRTDSAGIYFRRGAYWFE